MWMGKFNTASNVKMFGFKMNADGRIATPAVYTFTQPATDVNGIVCYSTSATDFWFYIVSSGGNGASIIRRVHYLKSSQAVQSSTTVFTGPPGMEGLTLVGSQVWSTSESGGRYYQEGSQLRQDLYPFLSGVVP